jgi:outer membrane protein
MEASLSRQVIDSHRKALLTEAGSATSAQPRVAEDPKLAEIMARRELLEKNSGPKAEIYAEMIRKGLPVGPSLDGSKVQFVELSVNEAVRRALDHNTDLKLARLAPAISEAQRQAAEAAFDFIFFTGGNFGKNDSPQAVPVIGAIPVGTSVRVQDTASLNTGIRKPLESGGSLTFSTGADYVNNKTPGFSLSPDPGWTNNLLIDLSQPLMRNFGTEVNRAQIDLTENLNKRDRLQLIRQTQRTVADVEEVYWQVSLARQQLVIRQRVLEATIRTRDTVFNRKELDGGPIQQAQAQTSVEAGRRDVIEAQRGLRDAIDQLKRLLQDPDLPLAGETLVATGDDPAIVAVEANLLDAVTTALRRRPEVQQAMLEIKDAGIRQKVAENQALPQLDMNAQVRYLGLGDGFSSGYDQLADGDFIEYLVGAQFEQPIGNRAGEANLRAAKLNRSAAVVRYKSVTRDVVAEVKQALRRLRTSWTLIRVSGDARLAAAENLRGLGELAKTERLTPSFLDLLLNAERSVANAEVIEYNAIIDYNIAIGRFHEATGTSLERKQIQIRQP